MSLFPCPLLRGVFNTLWCHFSSVFFWRMFLIHCSVTWWSAFNFFTKAFLHWRYVTRQVVQNLCELADADCWLASPGSSDVTGLLAIVKLKVWRGILTCRQWKRKLPPLRIRLTLVTAQLGHQQIQTQLQEQKHKKGCACDKSHKTWVLIVLLLVIAC